MLSSYKDLIYKDTGFAEKVKILSISSGEIKKVEYTYYKRTKDDKLVKCFWLNKKSIYNYYISKPYSLTFEYKGEKDEIAVPINFLTDGNSAWIDDGIEWIFHDYLYATHFSKNAQYSWKDAHNFSKNTNHSFKSIFGSDKGIIPKIRSIESVSMGSSLSLDNLSDRQIPNIDVPNNSPVFRDIPLKLITFPDHCSIMDRYSDEEKKYVADSILCEIQNANNTNSIIKYFHKLFFSTKYIKIDEKAWRESQIIGVEYYVNMNNFRELFRATR